MKLFLSLLQSCLSGYNNHDVRQACAEITGIANFLSSREANQKNISEWHILAAVLDRILLMIFAATFLFGSAYFYSEIGRHPVPDHPFKSWIGNENITRDDYTEYRGCNEYHTEHIVAG